MKRVLNVLPSKHQEKDWTLRTARKASLAGAMEALPQSVDLREPWWDIGDQGTTGSCVGWAVADSLLRWHFVKAQMLSRETRLSPRFIWMASKETDEFTERPTVCIEGAGTSLKAALQIARHYGAAEEDDLPFQPEVLYGGEEDTFFARASRYRIRNYFNLDGSPTAWRAWLAEHGPILARLDVDAAWMSAGSTGGKLDNYDASGTLGGHAVAIVGYTPEHFIVRNSWGTEEWGDQGYAYASVPYATAAFTESYGITI